MYADGIVEETIGNLVLIASAIRVALPAAESLGFEAAQTISRLFATRATADNGRLATATASAGFAAALGAF